LKRQLSLPVSIEASVAASIRHHPGVSRFCTPIQSSVCAPIDAVASSPELFGPEARQCVDFRLGVLAKGLKCRRERPEAFPLVFREPPAMAICRHLTAIALVLGLNLFGHTNALLASQIQWVCSPVPTYPEPKDPVVKVEISVQDGSWTISHIARSGKRSERSAQYWIADASEPNYYSWRGQAVGDPNLTMVGDISEGERPIYSERLYDQHKNGAQVSSVSFLMHSRHGAVPSGEGGS
jgi:hypothetical protein